MKSIWFEIPMSQSEMIGIKRRDLRGFALYNPRIQRFVSCVASVNTNKIKMMGRFNNLHEACQAAENYMFSKNSFLNPIELQLE